MLNLVKETQDKSWNITIYNLLKEHINSNKNYYRDFFKQIYSIYLKDNCEECGIENNYTRKSFLCIHHKDGDITNNLETNLSTLCNSCHGKQYPR